MFYSIFFSFSRKCDIFTVVIGMKIDKELIGKRIKDSREKAGLSQAQLAEMMNLSPNHVSSMERGKSLLTTKRLLMLCDILGGTPDYYLIGAITPETDKITALIKYLSPNDQKMLYQLLDTYLSNKNSKNSIQFESQNCKEKGQNC